MTLEADMRAYLDNMVAAHGRRIRAVGTEEDGDFTERTGRPRVDRFDEFQMETIRGMYLTNVPLRSIARHLSCTEGAIERLVLRLVRDGVIERRRPIPQGRKVDDANDGLIIDLYNGGLPLSDIADRLGKSINAIQIILRRLKRTRAIVARCSGRPRRHAVEQLRAAA